MTTPSRTVQAVRRRLHTRLGADSQSGSITLFMVVLSLGLLAAVGLVVDGGGKIRAVQRADAVAADAARAGGQAIAVGDAIRGDSVQAAPADAQAAAGRYLAAAGMPGSVSLRSGTQLSVDTTTTYSPVFLALVGVGTVTVQGHADVRLVRTLDGEQ